MRKPRTSTTAESLPRAVARNAQALLSATRYAYRLLGQLPLRPMLATFVMAFVLGIMPLILTVLYSLIRTVLDAYRGFTFRPAPPAVASAGHTLLNQLEPL